MRCLNNPDDFCEIIAEIAEPIDDILKDSDIKESYRNDSVFMFVANIIRRHKEQVKAVIAAMDGEISPEKTFEKYSTSDIVKMFIQIKEDPLFPELKQAFSSAQKNTGAASSGTARAATQD